MAIFPVLTKADMVFNLIPFYVQTRATFSEEPPTFLNINKPLSDSYLAKLLRETVSSTENMRQNVTMEWFRRVMEGVLQSRIDEKWKVKTKSLTILQSLSELNELL